MPSHPQPVRQPSTPRPQIQDIQRLLSEHPPFKMPIGLPPHLPLRRKLSAQIPKRQCEIIRRIVRPAPLRASNPQIVIQKPLPLSRQHQASTSAYDSLNPRRAASASTTIPPTSLF